LDGIKNEKYFTWHPELYKDICFIYESWRS